MTKKKRGFSSSVVKTDMVSSLQQSISYYEELQREVVEFPISIERGLWCSNMSIILMLNMLVYNQNIESILYATIWSGSWFAKSNFLEIWLFSSISSKKKVVIMICVSIGLLVVLSMLVLDKKRQDSSLYILFLCFIDNFFNAALVVWPEKHEILRPFLKSADIILVIYILFSCLTKEEPFLVYDVITFITLGFTAIYSNFAIYLAKHLVSKGVPYEAPSFIESWRQISNVKKEGFGIIEGASYSKGQSFITSHRIIQNIASIKRDLKCLPLWTTPRTQLICVINTQIIIIVIQLVLTFYTYSWEIMSGLLLNSCWVLWALHSIFIRVFAIEI